MPRYNQSLIYIPKSDNFSDLEVSYNDEGDLSFDAEIDDFSPEVLNNLNAEQSLLKILSEFNDRDKAIFAFQILRSTGYKITHASFAKTLGISRVRYMIILKKVKTKAAKIYESINKMGKQNQ